jgi:predicted CopG family antitoxin
MRAYNNYLDNQKVPTVATTATSSSSSAQRRKRLRLKRIVVSEHNYLALKRLGQAGDSFNDVISRLLQIDSSYQEKIQHPQEQEKENHRRSIDELPFSGSPYELFEENNRQQLADLLAFRRGNINSRNSQTMKQD